MKNRELSQTTNKLSSSCHGVELQWKRHQSTLDRGGRVLHSGIKTAWIKPALSNNLWLSRRLETGGGECVYSVTDGPDKEDDMEGTR